MDTNTKKKQNKNAISIQNIWVNFTKHPPQFKTLYATLACIKLAFADKISAPHNEQRTLATAKLYVSRTSTDI